MKFRHEEKFLISYSDYLAIKQNLNTFMKHDKYTNNKNEYKVKSLYFDNIYNKALKEKIDGVNNREKFRIRFYNNDFSFIKLEKKQKINGFSKKISVPITKEECEKILNNNINWMLYSEYDLIKELYVKMKTQLLKPKIIIEYTREPFIYNVSNIRITLDKEIKTDTNCFNFFNEKESLTAINNNIFIMEIKYDEYLPNIIKKLTNVGNKRQTSFSKYAICRNFK